MNKAFLTIGIILLGILALAGINLVGNYTMGNELDYYTLKETAQAAMTDAIDHNFFSAPHFVLRMDKEKFVESFILRFSNNVDNSRDYQIRMVDINEVPPKVSIEVKAGNLSWNPDSTTGNVEIINRIDGILVSDAKENPLASKMNSDGKL